jgi:outer membrane biosynthesis protein TonB
MSTTETPNDLKEPGQPEAAPSLREASSPSAADGAARPPLGNSRWLDYDSHELLEMISELEDERRWARLREGILWAVLLHILLLSAFTWIPKYVFKVPQLKDPFDAINKREDLKYIDVPPDARRTLQPKTVTKPVPQRQPHVDKKTLEALNKPTPVPPPVPPAEPPPTTPPPTPAITPPVQQPQVETPRPAATPRPNFAMGSQNPADQLRDAMRGAAHTPGGGQPNLGGGGLRMHPGAGSGGVEVLTPTNVDLSAWLQRWHHETERTWDPLIPDEVNPPILKSGMVAIRFKVLPNGRLMDGSLTLDGRSGDTALDRAAWGALTGSNYPPLPREFTGPYLEMRAYFLYNMEPGR